MRVNFEEKTYENYFNTELGQRTPIYFPLGQVQEGDLGFDASSFSRNRRFWHALGWFVPPYPGVSLRDIADEMEAVLGIELDGIPKMKSNLLFQYKKPEYVTSRSGKEWKKWKSDYYRYSIYQEQHELLNHIEKKFKNQVLILYASPAINNVDDLVTAFKKRTIIENSNFRKAKELNNHHRNTYVAAGTHSIACSEYEKLKNFDLIDLLQSSSKDVSQNTNKQFVLSFKNELLASTIQGTYISNAWGELNERLEKISRFPLFHAFMVMNNFRQLTGLQWLVTTEKEPAEK